jgi:hypothetical protein
MQHDRHAGRRSKHRTFVGIVLIHAFFAIAIARSVSIPRTNATATPIANTKKETEEKLVLSQRNTRIGKGHLEDGDDENHNRCLRYELYDNAVLSTGQISYEGTTSVARLSLEPPPQELAHSRRSSDSRSLSSPLILSGALTGSLSVDEVGREWNQLSLAKNSKTNIDIEFDAESETPPKTETKGDHSYSKRYQQNNSRHYWYIFDCVFDGTATGWVRVGSYLVCHDGNAYRHQHQDPILLLPNKHYAFRAILTTNITNATLEFTTSGENGNTNTSIKQSAPSLSIYWRRFLHSAGGRAKETRRAHHQQDITTTSISNSSSNPLDRGFRLLSTIEENHMSRDDPKDPEVVLHPTLPPHDSKRQHLQNELSKGWGQWLVPDLLSVTKLPEGIVVGIQICGRQSIESGAVTGNHRNCVGPVVPDSAGTIRVDRHSTDRSYASFNLTFEDPSNQHGSNSNMDNSSERPSGSISLIMESSVTGSGHENLRYLITVTDCDSCEGFVLEIIPRYAWFRPGLVFKNTNTNLTFSTPGLGDIDVRVLVEDDNDDNKDIAQKESLSMNALQIPLSKKGQKLGILAGPRSSLRSSDVSNTGKISLANLEKHIREMDKLEASRMERTFGSNHEVAQAIQATVMWSLIFNPIEGGPFLPVSRSPQWAETFASKAGAANSDWTYVIFGASLVIISV